MKRITEIIRSISKLKLKIKALYIFFIVCFVFLVGIAIAPVHKMKEFENLTNTDTLFLENYDSMYNHPGMELLVKEKAYKEALLKLAESDSIQMVINLTDSTVKLSIKGVVIHQTKVNTFEKDKIFKKMQVIEQVKLFSQALAVHSQYASIVKEPVVVRNAPKDTLEAALNVSQPDTLIQNPAFLFLSTEYGMHLFFEQDENPTFNDKWQKFNFYNRLRIQRSIKAFIHLVLFQKQEYHPTIIIKMPVDDLRAIYRALPNKALIVLKI